LPDVGGCLSTSLLRNNFSRNAIPISFNAQQVLLAMKSPLCAAAVFAAVITTGSARIGETEAQIAARYGQSIGDIPTEAFGKVRGFMQPGYVVGVAFVNGVSEMEMFSKNDQSEMSANEIENLLETNGAGEWKVEQTGKPKWKRWRRQDGALVALYDTARHFLYINSKKFFDAQGTKLETTAR
jgi:hypothetical protein